MVMKVLKHIKVKLPEETMTAIEKAVRHRGREGFYGYDFSHTAKYEDDWEKSLWKSHLDALVKG